MKLLALGAFAISLVSASAAVAQFNPVIAKCTGNGADFYLSESPVDALVGSVPEPLPTNKDTILVILTLGLYIYYVSYMEDVTYIKDRSLKPRTSGGEWVSSIAFAVIAATLVHTYFMQPYTIPTSSLEKSLLIGDFLFVSKFHYGARVPMTTVAAPMVHDTLPLVKTRSYLKKPQLPYFRLPALQKIKRNDIVVFSWPVDTVEQFFKKSRKKWEFFMGVILLSLALVMIFERI